MQADKSYRGWIVSLTVAGVITYFVLAVERDSRSTVHSGSKSTLNAKSARMGIWVNSDPSIQVLPPAVPAPITPAAAADARSQPAFLRDTAQLLTAPPEPVATVVLQAPTTIPEMVALSSSDAEASDQLVLALDRAFEVPVREVSLPRTTVAAPTKSIDDERLQSLLPKGALSGQIPEPVALLRDLSTLRGSHTVSTNALGLNPVTSSPAEAWAHKVETTLRRVVFQQGLLHRQTGLDLDTLLALTAQAHEVAQGMTNPESIARLGATAYAVERRVRVWQAVASCLNNANNTHSQNAPTIVAREQVHDLVTRIAQELSSTSDAVAWKNFLQLDDLIAWSAAPEDNWHTGHELAMQVLTRMQWERLTPQQATFLTQPAFTQLGKMLSPWAAEPIDFRQLLTDIEMLEDDPINRCRNSLAHTVQALRVSPYPEQRDVAETINDHYRNANIRLAVSSKLIDRLIPQDTVQARPVRQSILGADTRGNSQVRTHLNIRLIPDPHAWHLELGLEGDLHSATQSSKGPATFHQNSVAKINSKRTIRMDATSLNVKADATSVDTRQYLRGMSTNFDRIPLVSDFFRTVIHEQFEQQRGVAQRVVRRLIAEETDQEINKQLQEQVDKAEGQLQQTIVGPLERLELNPIVVSMNTTQDRLTVRYRVASDGQMAAHTTRPRAPGDSLASMQMHQSSINNALTQLGLSDKAWSLPELCTKLADAFDQKAWPLPDDIPQDITVKFAPSRPITVELRDGKLELTLRIAEFHHPERKLHFERFIIKTAYVPNARGLSAYLVRDGVVSIDGPRLGFSEKVPLRGIFGTVFSSQRNVSLINPQWLEDPRAEGLAVSQLEIRDGWLSVAISDQSSPHAARVAAAAETSKVQ